VDWWNCRSTVTRMARSDIRASSGWTSTRAPSQAKPSQAKPSQA